MRKKIDLHKAASMLVAFFIAIILPIAVYANSLPKVVDQAGLLSTGEIAELEARCNAVSEQYGLDVVIVTEDEYVSSAMNAADDFFDYNGYGVGEDHSGVLLYINMDTRDYWISTCGYGITVFTDDGIEYIGDKITSHLSDGDYYGAFSSFVSLCDDFAFQAKNDKPYTNSNLPKGPFPVIPYLIVSIAIGVIAALIRSIMLKGELKSVAPQDSAVDYITAGSVNVQDAGQIYLYRNVARTERAQSSSGSSSSTHTSSSGMTHGGGGGKF